MCTEVQGQDSHLEGALKGSPRLFYGWIIVGVAFTTFMISYGLRYSFSVFFPTILQEFKWSRAGTAGIFSLHIISYGLISPFSGRLADRYGPRKVIPLGAVIMGVGMIACSTVSELWQFYLLYGVLVPIGVCVSGWSQLVPAITRWFVKRRTTALGLASAGFALSFLLSSLTAPLVLYLGWRGSFVVLGLLPIMIIAPLAYAFVRSRPEELGVLPDGEKATMGSQVTSEGPLAPTISQAIRSFRFWCMFLAFFLVWGLGQSTILAHQIAYLRDLGYSETVGALVLASYGLIEVLGNLSSSLADKLKREVVFAAGSLGLAASIVLLMQAGNAESGLWLIYAYSVVFGFFNGLVGPVLGALPADLFQGENFGGINGLLMLGFGMGGALGPWLAGLFFDLTGAYVPVFYMVLASFLVPILLIWFAARPSQHKVAEIRVEPKR